MGLAMPMAADFIAKEKMNRKKTAIKMVKMNRVRSRMKLVKLRMKIAFIARIIL
jgi:division protein CdvB (Snf7/Vps24/ESCRT-III family)